MPVLFPVPDCVKIDVNGVESYSNAGVAPCSIQQFECEPMQAFVNGQATSSDSYVRFVPGDAANGHIRISLSGAGKQATKGEGTPIEFDLFAHLLKPPTLPTLASLSRLVVGVDLKFMPSAPVDQECALNAAVLSIDFTLVNPSTKEVWSYGIAMGKFSQHPSSGVWGPCSQRPLWFQKGPTAFGFAEPITGFVDEDGNAYGMLSENVRTPFDFDILQHILAALAAGAAQWGMDPNPANWEVASAVLGAHVFGHCAMQASAWDFQVSD